MLNNICRWYSVNKHQFVKEKERILRFILLVENSRYCNTCCLWNIREGTSYSYIEQDTLGGNISFVMAWTGNLREKFRTSYPEHATLRENSVRHTFNTQPCGKNSVQNLEQATARGKIWQVTPWTGNGRKAVFNEKFRMVVSVSIVCWKRNVVTSSWWH
jgi:hypothetical protein